MLRKMNRCVSFSNSSNGNSTCASSTSSLSAKLRRLKIEEGILLQSINSNSSVHSEHNFDADPQTFLTFTEFKKFFENTKTTFNNLKRLFQDIKASTSSKEVIKSVDIDDIKKNTLELENKIRMYKVHLQKELTVLKAAERQLNEKLNDPRATEKLKRKPRVQTAKYTEIVQSPVKTLMTSPLKSSKLQPNESDDKSTPQTFYPPLSLVSAGSKTDFSINVTCGD